MMHFKKTNYYMLTYRRSYKLEINGYTLTQILSDDNIVKDPLQAIFICWLAVKFFPQCQTNSYGFIHNDSGIYSML